MIATLHTTNSVHGHHKNTLNSTTNSQLTLPTQTHGHQKENYINRTRSRHETHKRMVARKRITLNRTTNSQST